MAKRTQRWKGDKPLIRSLILLRRGCAPFSVAEMAAEFSVSERTVQRTIMSLWAAGFKFDTLAKGTYRLAEGQHIPVKESICQTK